jgi:hypothetical protein
MASCVAPEKSWLVAKEAEIRYFLSSCRDDPTVLVQAIRRPIEN